MDIVDRELRDLVARHGVPVSHRLVPGQHRWLGRCHVTSHIIDISSSLADHHPASIIDVTRHEYAHLLAYVWYGVTDHSRQWREIARLLGCVPAPSSTETMRVEAARRRERET